MYVNILSLDRSRSTITNMHLTDLYGGIALGEVGRTINPIGTEADFLKRGNKCSCGKLPSDCNFWSDIMTDENPYSKYIRKIQDESLTIFDSSKTIRHSRLIRTSFNHSNIMSICLIRDFKGWSTSILNAQKRNNEGLFINIFKNRYFVLSNVRLFLRKFLIARYLEYMITNVRLIHEARKYPLCSVVTDSSLLETYPIKRTKASIHILRGNRVRARSTMYKHWNCTDDLSVKILGFIDRNFIC